MREARLAGLVSCEVNGGAGWNPTAATRAEAVRLGGPMPVSFAGGNTSAQGLVAVIRGDALPPAQAIADAVAGRNEPVEGVEITSGPGIDEAIARAVSAGRDAAARDRKSVV